MLTLFFVFIILAYFNYTIYSENHVKHVCHKNDLDVPASEEEINATATHIVMTQNERVLLWRYLQKSKSYFEYGAGGSSELACKLDNIKHFVTVDSSNEFMMDLKHNSTCLSNSKIWIPHHVDIGPTHVWGYPKELRPRQWLKYSEGVLDFKHLNPDLILVDARFRLLCALISFMHYESVPVLIHDFYPRHDHYSMVFEFAELVDCADHLVVLRSKPDMDKILLQERIDHIVFHQWPHIDREVLKQEPWRVANYLGTYHIA
jgi:hypothetical protein